MSGSDRLGRGLGALLGDYMQEPVGTGTGAEAPARIPIRIVAPTPTSPDGTLLRPN